MSKKTVEIEECYGGVEWRGPEFVTVPFKSKRKKKRPVWKWGKNMFGHVKDEVVEAQYKPPKPKLMVTFKDGDNDIDDNKHEIPVFNQIFEMGDGQTRIFYSNMPGPIVVTVDGLDQVLGVDYFNSGQHVVFNAAPKHGAIISIACAESIQSLAQSKPYKPNRAKKMEPVRTVQPQVNLFARREINFNED